MLRGALRLAAGTVTLATGGWLPATQGRFLIRCFQLASPSPSSLVSRLRRLWRMASVSGICRLSGSVVSRAKLVPENLCARDAVA